MMEVKTLFEQDKETNLQPVHNCKQNLKIIEQTHSVNSLHNIVIARIQQCKICKKKFEQFDPKGLDKLF